MGSDDAKDLVVEIFRETGYKVDADDPIVVAALYQASLIRGAGQETSENIAGQTARLEKAVQQIMAHLQELVRTSGATASAKMKEAREQQEIELQRSVAASIDAAIEKAASRAISRFGEALKTLEVSAVRAEQKVAAAAEASRPGWSALIAGVTALSALLGGLAGFLASRAF